MRYSDLLPVRRAQPCNKPKSSDVRMIRPLADVGALLDRGHALEVLMRRSRRAATTSELLEFARCGNQRTEENQFRLAGIADGLCLSIASDL